MTADETTYQPPETPLSQELRLPDGPVDLASHDPRATPGYPGKGKKDADAVRLAIEPELSELQERLYASGRSGVEGTPSVLVVLQGMDTSGKGGIIRHAIGMVDPQGVQLKAFKAPTEEERAHHYLWRIRTALPQPGMIGIFDRSHYEDVLVPRVRGELDEDAVGRRLAEIAQFEQELVAGGTRLVKCFLHISADKQLERLMERLDNPDKHWKYNPGDVDSRRDWPAYQRAYIEVLGATSTATAPWYVIPADRKWYRNWAVAQLLLEQLRALDLQWPRADFDVAVEKKRLAATRDVAAS
ncbi:PPK2 family polyphosphate kinase [Desertihabitans aurantiacus]|uniref:PPK2 family polyphosphate kinase n=1 Tax=Desertihabitans aurantiacus TaxID=2282477 RepID=UPI000DF80E20|nr:PPK2 family polyphosphate kinase [Desertihabitans aurantiacus]